MKERLLELSKLKDTDDLDKLSEDKTAFTGKKKTYTFKGKFNNCQKLETKRKVLFASCK